ncbi:hypothetical protein [Nostoc sp. FACHB-280]|nr:hypothetical protein [Nostoc sp. FACHB-280]MBD2495075.1 hypothetical protein [Nostoc sp. FACHB-280]
MPGIVRLLLLPSAIYVQSFLKQTEKIAQEFLAFINADFSRENQKL